MLVSSMFGGRKSMVNSFGALRRWSEIVRAELVLGAALAASLE
jgi:hypothetical protein